MEKRDIVGRVISYLHNALQLYSVATTLEKHLGYNYQARTGNIHEDD